MQRASFARKRGSFIIQLLSNFLRFVLSYIMSLVFMIFLAFIHLSAVVGNLPMLLSCFKDEKKYSFLQRGRMFLIIQWVCQVTILVADTVESWKVFAIHFKKSCNIFRVLSLSVLFFQACNLLAIVTIVLETPVKRGNREFFDQTQNICSPCSRTHCGLSNNVVVQLLFLSEFFSDGPESHSFCFCHRGHSTGVDGGTEYQHLRHANERTKDTSFGLEDL